MQTGRQRPEDRLRQERETKVRGKEDRERGDWTEGDA